MKVLVIGGGGREHAIAWKLAQSPRVEKVFCAPGNPGIARVAECVGVEVGGDFAAVRTWAKDHAIDLTIVGPEAPLVDGIVDAFEADGLKVCGPSRAAAQMEGSKIFAKDFMLEAGIPTGAAQYFTQSAPAIEYLETLSAPYVIKASGLAAGKGAVVAHSLDEARDTVRQMLDERVFGEAGERVLIEEFLEGEEASMLAFTDGTTVLPMSSAQDHKPIFDGDKGPNTGGMGAYSPAPVVTPELEKEIFDTILQPTVDGLRKRGILYKGILYAGLMIGRDGRPRVVEFNCRFGDPETQPLLMRLDTDLAEVALAIAEERLGEIELRWRPGASVCVVLASGGYPGSYEKGKEIEGLDKVREDDSIAVFHAGTAMRDGRVVTSGGRVLGVTALAPTVREAIDRAYTICGRIRFDGVQFRRDIGKKALDRLAS
ncbi:phosphoribosylamine--glycine ligase [Candidatus Sumerlaeota bacterium]|nr:phosphoribosylamine--glycine ligase [Candidatus Sumerlaeota bacterium]